MTNEQLAALIGEGGNDELLPILWEKMRKFYRMASDKYARQHADKCAQCGVTADDIRQESYFAMLDSIKAYNDRKPEQEALHFISFCGFHFRHYADLLIGNNRRGTHKDPLKNAVISLDEALPDKDGDTDTTRGELIPDPEAEKPFQLIEREDYRQWIRQIMRQALNKYENPRLWEVIDGYYFQRLTLQQIADEWGTTKERVRQTRENALRKLQRSAELRKQYMLSEYHHIGLEAFTRGGSIVERVAEQHDQADAYDDVIRRIIGDGDTERDKAKREILREILERQAARENLQAPAPEKVTA